MTRDQVEDQLAVLAAARADTPADAANAPVTTDTFAEEPRAIAVPPDSSIPRSLAGQEHVVVPRDAQPETMDELIATFGVLREHGVQVLTVGQYLRPTENHLPVVRYWHPDEFAELEREAYAMGFDSVAAGPLVRSSYHAEQTLRDAAAKHEVLPRGADAA